jgi:hypothetical protein
LLSYGLNILGIFLILGAFFGGMQSSLYASMFGGNANTVIPWIMGIVGVVCFLGGVYMRRR